MPDLAKSIESFLCTVCLLRDSISDAVRLDADSPLPEVPGAGPDAGAFCLSRLDIADGGSLERVEMLVRAAIASAEGDREVLALEGVADAYHDFLDDARAASFDERDVDQAVILRLNDAIVRARRFASGHTTNAAALAADQPPTASDTPTNKSEDGPVPPNAFLFNGNQFDGLAKQPFLALHYLWSAPNRAAPQDDLAEPVFGDREELVDIGQIHNIRRDLNEFFRRHSLPFKAAVSNGYLAVKPMMTPASKSKTRRPSR